MTDVDFSVTDVVSSNFLVMEVDMGANQFTENSVSHLDLPHASGVYMITDKASGVRYIGSSVDIRRRAMQHFAEMKAMRREQPAYEAFKPTYDRLGPQGFDVTVLLLCDEKNLLMYEAQCISVLGETVNRYKRSDDAEVYSAEECQKKSDRVKALWATPEYRERAIAARKGNAYNKGYKCTPEQVENRKKAGRISNMKRNYGVAWQEEYARRYPEFVGDLDGY
jgi:hypothetical protein